MAEAQEIQAKLTRTEWEIIQRFRQLFTGKIEVFKNSGALQKAETLENWTPPRDQKSSNG